MLRLQACRTTPSADITLLAHLSVNGHLGPMQLLIGHNTAGALLQFECGMFPIVSCV